MKRILAAAMLPGIGLLCALALALSIGAFSRWVHRGDLPAEIAFAQPVARALDADHVQIIQAYRAGHYETNGIRAAGFRTNLGIVIAMSVPDSEAARRTVDAVARSFGTRPRALGTQVVVITEPAAIAALNKTTQ